MITRIYGHKIFSFPFRTKGSAGHLILKEFESATGLNQTQLLEESSIFLQPTSDQERKPRGSIKGGRKIQTQIRELFIQCLRITWFRFLLSRLTNLNLRPVDSHMFRIHRHEACMLSHMRRYQNQNRQQVAEMHSRKV